MQVCVTLAKRKNRFFGKKFVICLSVTIVLFSGFLSAFYFSKNKKINYFEPSTFYFVYSEKSLKKSYLSKKTEEVESIGGAGVILQFDEMFYLILGVYKTKDEAENVVKNNEEVLNLEILKKETKKISLKKQSKIKSEVELFEFVKLLDEMVEKMYESFDLYSNFNETSNEVLVCAEKFKLKFENFEQNDEIIELLGLLNLFTGKFETSKNKVKVFLEFLINVSNFKLNYFKNL